MINSSSERQKSRRNENRGKRKEISLDSRKVNPLRSVQTPTRYGSTTSPIREKRVCFLAETSQQLGLQLESNPKWQTDIFVTMTLWKYRCIERIEYDTTDTPGKERWINCSTQRRRNPNRNTNEVKRIYTKKERMIISVGGRYGVPFRLALSPACSTSTTTHKRTGKTQCMQNNCKTTTGTPAQHTILLFVFCFISKGLAIFLWPWAKLLPKHTPNVTTLFHASQTYIYWSIETILIINNLPIIFYYKHNISNWKST